MPPPSLHLSTNVFVFGDVSADNFMCHNPSNITDAADIESLS